MGTSSGTTVGSVTDPQTGNTVDIQVNSKLVTRASGSASQVKNWAKERFDDYNKFSGKQIIKEDTIAGKLLGKVDVGDILTKVGLGRTAKDFWKNVKNLAKKDKEALIEAEKKDTEDEKNFLREVLDIVLGQQEISGVLDMAKILKIKKTIKKYKFHTIKVKAYIVSAIDAINAPDKVVGADTFSYEDKVNFLTAAINEKTGQIEYDPLVKEELAEAKKASKIKDTNNLISQRDGLMVPGVTMMILQPYFIYIKDFFKSDRSTSKAVQKEIAKTGGAIINKEGKHLVIPHLIKARTDSLGQAKLKIPYPFVLLPDKDEDEVQPVQYIDFSKDENDQPTNLTSETIIDNYSNSINLLVYPVKGLLPPISNEAGMVSIIKEDGTFKKQLDIKMVDANLVDINTEFKVLQGIKTGVGKIKTNLALLQDQTLKSLINAQLETIKDRVVPKILRTALAFGMTNMYQFVTGKTNNMAKQCPPEEKLNKLIKARNSLTRALNSIYSMVKTVNVVLTGARIATTVVQAAMVALSVLQKYFATAGPATQAKETAKNKVLNLMTKIEWLAPQLILVQVYIRVVLDMLKILDMAIEQCGGNLMEPSEAERELLRITQDTGTQGKIVDEMNGFKFKVEQDNANSFGTTNLRRRRAVAINKQGIQILKGEPSFSASDQVLIDELVFYVTINNLRGD